MAWHTNRQAAAAPPPPLRGPSVRLSSHGRGVPIPAPTAEHPAEPRAAALGASHVNDSGAWFAPRTPSPGVGAGQLPTAASTKATTSAASAMPKPLAPAAGDGASSLAASRAVAAASATVSRLAAPRTVAALGAAAAASRYAVAAPTELAAALRGAGLAAAVAGGGGDGSGNEAHPKKQKGVFERSAARYKFVLIAPPSPPPSASTPWAPPSPTRFNWPGSPGSTLSSSPPLAPRPPQPPVALPPALIVEPRLREAFEAAIILDNATGVSAQDELTTYAALVRALPAVFVGDAEQLRALVEWMAARMGAAFAAAGRELPPWRSASALLARWRLDLDEA